MYGIDSGEEGRSIGIKVAAEQEATLIASLRIFGEAFEDL